MLTKWMNWLYQASTALNFKNILELAELNPAAVFLDLGCDDGVWTEQVAKKIGTKSIYAVEVVEESADLARKRGIQVTIADLEKKWPYPDNKFDVVHANFVIEHFASVDNFISELYRVLAPGGYVLISTENGSSWHNIFASIMGWQTFSSSCFSQKMKGLGNPLGLHRGQPEPHASQTYKVIFNYFGFLEFFKVFGFKNMKILGAGYHPLPASFGSFDVRHAHFMVIKAYK